MPNVEILSITPMPPFLSERLNRDYILHELGKAKDKQAMIAELGPRVRGLVPGGSSLVKDDLMGSLPKLEIISVFGVGYEGVDLDAAQRRNLIVTNTPDVLTECVADIALGLTLCVLRRLAHAHHFVVAGDWEKRGFPFGDRLATRTAGILGLGRIGKAIARRLEACGMRIAYHGRKAQAGVAYRYYDSLTGMARDCDVLVVACPGGAETRNIVNAEVFSALGKKGVVVNIARGSVIDEPALIAALASGAIKGAGLDVFADEPRVPEALRKLDNVVLLPHIGSASVETRTAMAYLCCDNLDAHFAGKPVLTRVV